MPLCTRHAAEIAAPLRHLGLVAQEIKSAAMKADIQAVAYWVKAARDVGIDVDVRSRPTYCPDCIESGKSRPVKDKVPAGTHAG